VKSDLILSGQREDAIRECTGGVLCRLRLAKRIDEFADHDVSLRMDAKVSNPLFCSARSELNAKELTIGAGILVRASAEYPLKLGGFAT
jgi:hypothetical protein